MLVEAPAAVEDALASLLDHTDLLVQRRALATYVRRLYYPFLLHEPELAAAEAPQALVAGGGGGGWVCVCVAGPSAYGPTFVAQRSQLVALQRA